MGTETHTLYDGDVELVFNSGKHTYTVDGKKVVSVTGVCKVIDKSGPLMWWAVNEARDYIKANMQPGREYDEVEIHDLADSARMAHRKASTKAANIGTFVHDFAEAFLKFRLGEGDEPAWPTNEQVKNGAVAFLDWYASNNVEPIAMERKVYSRKLKVAGTTDLIAKINRRLCIVDYKTGSGIYEEAYLQVGGAYWPFYEEETGEKIQFGWILRFPQDRPEATPEMCGWLQERITATADTRGVEETVIGKWLCKIGIHDYSELSPYTMYSMNVYFVTDTCQRCGKKR